MTTKLLISVLSLVLVFSLVTLTVAVPRLSYTELKTLGASCSPALYDTCSVPRERNEDNLMKQNCECNPSCYIHRTCCIDSPHLFGSVKSKALPRKESCQSVIGTDSAVFMVSKCNPRWRGSSIVRSKCQEDVKSFRDPIGLAPVTNPRTQTTYKNVFCAVCNNDHRHSVVWSIKLKTREQRSHDENKLLNALVFDESKNKWGIFEGDTYASMEFKPIDIAYKVPTSLKNIEKPCPPGLVSECSSTWRDQSIKQKCEAYLAIISVPSNISSELEEIPYRNIHCAICNYVNHTSNDVCFTPGIRKLDKPALSFSLLLDVNLSDGEKVGEVNPCGKNEMYDPFFKTCRALVCALPGYIIKNRSCVRS